MTEAAGATERTGLGSSGERVPLLADTPLRDPELDGFGFVAFAHALCLVVDNERTATPLTIAVSAPWGGGKSSVGGMLQTLLERRVARRGGDHPRLVCWFNAWEHEDADHLGAALAAAVARGEPASSTLAPRAVPAAERDARAADRGAGAGRRDRAPDLLHPGSGRPDHHRRDRDSDFRYALTALIDSTPLSPPTAVIGPNVQYRWRRSDGTVPSS